jgi:hypothetical protein
MPRSDIGCLVERAWEGDREAFGEESLNACGVLRPHRLESDQSHPELERVVAGRVCPATLRCDEDSADGGRPWVPGKG